MKREEMSVFEIFQDPLLTIIALILLSTLWIIIPGEEPPPEPIEHKEGTPDPAQIQKEMDSLREQIRALEERINELEAELKRFQDEINTLSALEQDANKKKEQMKQQVEQLRLEIERLRNGIQEKRVELRELEDRLKQVKTDFEVGKNREEEAVRKLEEEIDKIEREIAAKQEQLSKLISELDQAKKDLDKAAEDRKAIGEETDVLQQKIQEQKTKISNLEKEKSDLQSNVKKITQGGGLGTYSKVTGKDTIAFEVVSNKLVLIDDKNYNVKTYKTISGNWIVSESELTRKSSCMSESMEKIKQEASVFQKEIKGKGSSHYLHFLVHEDSFEAFLEARQIAWEKGFEVAWWPFNGDKIYAGSGGDGPPVRRGGK